VVAVVVELVICPAVAAVQMVVLDLQQPVVLAEAEAQMLVAVA
jgi:hypothetical protein